MGKDKTYKLSGLLALALVVAGPSEAAFQEALWGARPAALNGAYTALANDANAPAYNPAGISLIPESEVTIMYAQLYTGLDLFVGDQQSDLGLGYFSYAPNIRDKKYGSFAVSWTNFVATNLLREDNFTLTYADSYQFDRLQSMPVLAYGINLKYLRRSFSTDERTDVDPVFRNGRDANAVTADLGLIYKPNFAVVPGLNFGFAAQNVTEPDMGLAQKDRVPAKYVLGIAYQDNRTRWFNPSLDIGRRDGRTIVSAGWESMFARDTFAFRLGGGEDQLTGGLGYQFKIFSGLAMGIDYAILWPLNVEGSNGSHRVSLTTRF